MVLFWWDFLYNLHKMNKNTRKWIKILLDKLPQMWYNWRPEHVRARPNFHYTTAPTNLSRGNVAQKEIIYFPVICAVCLLQSVCRCVILSMSVRESNPKGRKKFEKLEKSSWQTKQLGIEYRGSQQLQKRLRFSLCLFKFFNIWI